MNERKKGFDKTGWEMMDRGVHENVVSLWIQSYC